MAEQRIEIDDPADPRLRDYVALRDVSLRRSLESAHGLYIAEGTKVIERATAAGHRPRSLLLAPRWLDQLAPVIAELAGRTPALPVLVAEEAVVEQVTGFHVHRGALGAFHRPALRPVDDVVSEIGAGVRSRVAVLEDLVDHTNVGAVFRSAAALGVDAVLVTPKCADPLYRRSIKVSMGSVFQVPWTRIEPWPAGIDRLRQAGYVVAGMSLGEQAIPLDALVARNPPRLALVFGTEGHGLAVTTDRMIDVRVTIPMLNGVDSLNVAASSAVAFYATR